MQRRRFWRQTGVRFCRALGALKAALRRPHSVLMEMECHWKFWKKGLTDIKQSKINLAASINQT